MCVGIRKTKAAIREKPCCGTLIRIGWHNWKPINQTPDLPCGVKSLTVSETFGCCWPWSQSSRGATFLEHRCVTGLSTSTGSCKNEGFLHAEFCSLRCWEQKKRSNCCHNDTCKKANFRYLIANKYFGALILFVKVVHWEFINFDSPVAQLWDPCWTWGLVFILSKCEL